MTAVEQSPDTTASSDRDAVVASRVRLWLSNWREIKLRALEHRFYYNQAWEVREGDWYTITRHGPMLYRVGEFSLRSIVMLHMVNDDGVVQPAAAQEWQAEEFLTGGFAGNRIHLPEHVWTSAA